MCTNLSIHTARRDNYSRSAKTDTRTMSDEFLYTLESIVDRTFCLPEVYAQFGIGPDRDFMSTRPGLTD